MSDEITVGDTIQLNNTEQQGEVLEVINVHTGEPGPLLRVQLHDTDTGTRKGKAGKATSPEIAYWPEHSAMKVQAAEPKSDKKIVPDEKANHGKQADHGEKKK